MDGRTDRRTSAIEMILVSDREASIAPGTLHGGTGPAFGTARFDQVSTLDGSVDWSDDSTGRLSWRQTSPRLAETWQPLSLSLALSRSLSLSLSLLYSTFFPSIYQAIYPPASLSVCRVVQQQMCVCSCGGGV
ncbi:unnamed protein product [Protopolystoma xenopodis]|uniref:Uncharacterized protein n=1 Tax=Protopolystoma xenopodis TaxID=117903 RepID=A0A448X230_9PLAT|nr:unnamed protein product [Protopolystoma xenopodis]